MQPAGNLHARNGTESAGNVLTGFSARPAQNTFSDQTDNIGSSGSDGVADIIAFKDYPLPDPLKMTAEKEDKGQEGEARAAGIDRAGVDRRRKTIFELDRLARRAGLIPVLLTIRAPKDKPLVEGKDFIQTRTARLGQALQRPTRHRKGTPHIGLTVYEIGRNEGHLHAHHMVYLANRADMKIVARVADVFEKKPTRKRHDVVIHARPACETDIGYMTKQRLPLSPDVEANIKHIRVPGGSIPGPRWSLLGISMLCERGRLRLRTSDPARHKQSYRSRPTTGIRQFGLPLDWKPSRPPTDAALMAQFCEVFGYTQQQAAERLEYRDRSHVANILRGHDGMSPARRKWI